MLENDKIETKIGIRITAYIENDFTARLSMFLSEECSSMNVYNKLVPFDFTYAAQTLILFSPICFNRFGNYIFLLFKIISNSKSLSVLTISDIGLIVV